MYTMEDIYKIYPKCPTCDKEDFLVGEDDNLFCDYCSTRNKDSFYFQYLSLHPKKYFYLKVNNEYSVSIIGLEKINISIYENKNPCPIYKYIFYLDKEFYMPTQKELINIVENLIFV